MKNVKIASILISTSLSILILSGCNVRQSSYTKESRIPMKSPATMKSSMDSTAVIKTHYANVLKTLVKDKVITQNQSNKVLVGLTNNISNGRETNMQNGANTNNNTGSTPGTGTGTPGTGTPYTNNGAETTPGTTYTNNGLSTLVASGVISKEQATIIDQKIKGL